MKNRITTLLLIVCGLISLAAVGRFLIRNGILMTNLDGNSFSITNLASVSAGNMTNSGLLGTPVLGTDANGRLIAGTGGSGGSGIQTNSGTGYNNNLTNVTLSSNVLQTNGFLKSDAISAATITNSGLLSALVLGTDANGRIIVGSLIAATNNDTVVSNALFAFAQQQTNNFDTIVDVNAKLISATNNALALATNNDTVVSNAVFNFAQQQTNNFDTTVDVNAKLVSATNNVLALATNNDTVVSNALFTFAQQQTNNFDTIVDVNAKLVSATNNALTLATNNDTAVSNAVFTFALQQTNNFDTIVDVTAKLVSATNNALTLATNNDRLISQNATNQGIVVSNGVIAALGSAAFTSSGAYDASGAALTATNGLAIANTNQWQPKGSYDVAGAALTATNQLAIAITNEFDPINSALNATNTTRLAANLAGSFDPLNAALNATNTARLVVNLASSFDASGAAQTATNQLAIANTNQWDPINSALNATNTTRLAANLAGSFDPLNAALNATNTARLAVNLAGSFDASGAALTATNQLAIANTNQWDPINSALNSTNTARLAVNLAGSFDALNAAQNATNTANLAVNLAGSFDALNAGLNATNGLYKLTQPGYTWTTKVTTPASGISYASQMAFGNGQFVQIIGDGTNFAESMYSSDGRNWATNFVMPASNVIWKSMVYGGGQFVAISSNSALYASSSDGLHWTSRSASAIDNWVSVAYGNGLYVSCSADSPSSFFSSSKNGQSGWTSGASVSGVLRCITFGGQLWVVVGDAGKIFTSPDGQTWVSQTSPNSSAWTGVIYGNGLYVAWASAGSTTANSLITSVDGTNWFAQTISFAGPDSIAYGSGVFIGYKGGTGAMASPDGTNWTSVTGTISGKVNGAVFGNGLFSVSSGTESQTSGKPQQYLGTSGNIDQGGLIVNGGLTNAGLTSADAIATDSNGKEIAATAILMTHIAQPGYILTNNEKSSATFSNVINIDAAHALYPSNATPSRIAMIGADNTLTNAGTASAAVPINADGSASTILQVSSLGAVTNSVTWQVANYNITASDVFVLLSGAHTATLPDPTASGVYGRWIYVQCSSAGTNAILQHSAETINGSMGLALVKITNTAVGKMSAFYSNRTNWWAVQFQ